MQLIREVRFEDADKAFPNEHIGLLNTDVCPPMGAVCLTPEHTFVSPVEVTVL